MVSVNRGTPGGRESDDTTIEQLWYTMSDLGIEAFSRFGYHIRAASPGLSNPRSEHIRQLDRYQRYRLPGGADFALDPQFAPISLALIDTGSERILVHKVYTGRDAVGRYGAFFVHLLANLPAPFTALDAISLWRSSFWRTADDVGQPQRSSTQLPSLSLDDVRKQEQDGRPTGKQFDAQIKQFLPYLIEAYLTKNLRAERTGATRPKLYIAAQDDLLAEMISGLLHALPLSITQDLTFSTYEHDVSEATTEIVGTCWPSDPAQEQNWAIRQLLPAQYFQNRLALNCYTGECTELKNSPLVEQHPLVARLAQDATSYVLNNMPSKTRFARLLALAQKYPQLPISDFLDLYSRVALRAKELSQTEIEAALSPSTPVEYEILVEHLSDRAFREKLIELIFTVPGWWKKYRSKFIDLHRHSKEYLLLEENLASISKDSVYPLVMNTLQREAARLKSSAEGDGSSPSIEAALNPLLDVMYYMTPPETSPEIWFSLLHDMGSLPQLPLFISLYWSVYAPILRMGASLKPSTEEGTDLIAPLLKLPWERFADFLALSLPSDWVVVAADHLAYKSPQPGPETVKDLERRAHSQLQALFQRMAQDYQQWKTAAGLFDALVQGNYQRKMQLLSLLLDSPMGEDYNTTRALLAYARFTPAEQSHFLAKYGPRYLLDSRMTNRIMEMFAELARGEQQREKVQILLAWLDDSSLRPWLAQAALLKIPSREASNFARVLQVTRLSPEQAGEVLVRFGPTYIPLYPASPTLLSLFKDYAELKGQQRLAILSLWLDCELAQKTMEDVLATALLDVEERRSVLLQYGERYLALYPDSSILLSYVQEFLEYLQTADMSIFRSTHRAGRGPSEGEKLLESLTRMPKASFSDLASRWYTVARFLRDSSTLNTDWKQITPAIDRLVTDAAKESAWQSLLWQLAYACISIKAGETHQQGQTTLIQNVGSLLSRPNRERFLLDVAGIVGLRIHDRRLSAPDVVPYVQLGFLTKTMFPTESEQVLWIDRYLNTLFYRNDRKMINDISNIAGQWSKRSQADWQRYVNQQRRSNGTTSSLFKPLETLIDLFRHKR